MFGIGTSELIVILGVALIVVGPKKLPDLAKSLGKGLREFRQATDKIKETINENEAYQDLKEIRDTVQGTVSSLNPTNLLDVPEITSLKTALDDPLPLTTPAAPPAADTLNALEEASAPELARFEPPLPPSIPDPDLPEVTPEENLTGRIHLMDAIALEHEAKTEAITAEQPQEESSAQNMTAEKDDAALTETSIDQAEQPTEKDSHA